jgi:hypothetical protein
MSYVGVESLLFKDERESVVPTVQDLLPLQSCRDRLVNIVRDIEEFVPEPEDRSGIFGCLQQSWDHGIFVYPEQACLLVQRNRSGLTRFRE